MTNTCSSRSVFGRFVLSSPLLLFIAFLGIPFAGCSSSSGDLPDIGKVRGTVTLDGKPLSDVEVLFFPNEGGRMSNAVTDENGQYELEYMRGAKVIYGAKVGNHKVSILAVEDEDSDEPAAVRIPKRYRGSKSELTATVESGTNDPVDFELKSP